MLRYLRNPAFEVTYLNGGPGVASFAVKPRSPSGTVEAPSSQSPVVVRLSGYEIRNLFWESERQLNQWQDRMQKLLGKRDIKDHERATLARREAANNVMRQAATGAGFLVTKDAG